MKLIHLSDLHLGKRVNEFSLLEDQEYILMKIIHIMDEEKPEVVLIAGDIYDKSIPPAEAIQLFDSFLVRLSQRGISVFVISGNHDSPERMAFGRSLMSPSGVYLSPVFEKDLPPISLEDAHGKVHIFMLPFIKPAHVRATFPGEEINSYTDALGVAIGNMEINPMERNVLITHQLVTGALRSDSEEISLGGSDNVDLGVFEAFDYVALGHIHRPQRAGREEVRYCGTPLKYSFSECNHQKSVTVVELQEKGQVEIRTVPLTPKRDLREIKGSYMEVTARDFYKNTNKEDYLHITLTDEEDVPDALGKLRAIYPNIMKLDYDNTRTRQNAPVSGALEVEAKSPLTLFSELYRLQNNQELSEAQKSFLGTLMEKIWEGRL